MAASVRRPYAHQHARPLVAPPRVRRWAAERGIPVGTRGRLSPTLVEQYRIAVRAEQRRIPRGGRS